MATECRSDRLTGLKIISQVEQHLASKSTKKFRFSKALAYPAVYSSSSRRSSENRKVGSNVDTRTPRSRLSTVSSADS